MNNQIKSNIQIFLMGESTEEVTEVSLEMLSPFAELAKTSTSSGSSKLRRLSY